MSKKIKTRVGTLMALTLSANLLSQTLTANADEVETDQSQADVAAVTEVAAAQEAETTVVPEEVTETVTETELTADTAVAETATETAAEITVPQAGAEAAETAEETGTKTSQSSVVTTDEDGTPVAIEAVSAETSEQATAAQDVIMPAYRHPWDKESNGQNYWSQITALGGSQIPYVIINPSNGSGSAADATFAQQIASNTAAGIKSIGYVNTNKFSRSQSEVFADVDNYFNFYGQDNIAGIFFDEAQDGQTAESISYMQTLYNYVKAKSSDLTVMANPGAAITDGIAPYADIWLTSETDAATYIDNFHTRTSAFETNASNTSRIFHLIHTASTDQYDQIIQLSRERNAGYLMITTDTLNNPFDELPSDFASLVARINAGGNGSATPNTDDITTTTPITNPDDGGGSGTGDNNPNPSGESGSENNNNQNSGNSETSDNQNGNGEEAPIVEKIDEESSPHTDTNNSGSDSGNQNNPNPSGNEEESPIVEPIEEEPSPQPQDIPNSENSSTPTTTETGNNNSQQDSESSHRRADSTSADERTAAALTDATNAALAILTEVTNNRSANSAQASASSSASANSARRTADSSSSESSDSNEKDENSSSSKPSKDKDKSSSTKKSSKQSSSDSNSKASASSQNSSRSTESQNVSYFLALGVVALLGVGIAAQRYFRRKGK